MKILHLTNENNTQAQYIESIVSNDQDSYHKKFGKFDLSEISSYDFIIKDRYHHDIDDDVFALNIPILAFIPAYLPFNKGLNSILWSILDGTPMGGSIFFLRNNNYSSDVVKRFEVNVSANASLATQFNLIFDLIYQEFGTIWAKIRNEQVDLVHYEKNDGSYHDGEVSSKFISGLPAGYTTKLSQILELWKIKGYGKYE